MEKAGEALIDLAVIGGGPAGTAAAIEARRRGLTVAVWERERFPRDKVCGEFISAESLPLLEAAVPAALVQSACITRSEFISPRGRAHTFALPLPARGLSRRVLDEVLWKAASAAGAETREGEAVRRLAWLEPADARPPCWELDTGAGITRRARFLIIACGRWWMIEGFPSPAREGSHGGAGAWLGAKAHFRGVAARDAVEMFYFRGGYCGLAPIEDGLYNACCLVHRSLAREAGPGGLGDFAAWLKTVAQHPALEARLRGTTQVSETVATAPVRPARRRADCDGALLVGDAAGFLDPFTGDGISMALHSGWLAAEDVAGARTRGSADARSMVHRYRRRLGRAVRRSYMLAGVLRALVYAPGGVQELVAGVLPWLGSRLHAETRWKAGNGARIPLRAGPQGG